MPAADTPTASNAGVIVTGTPTFSPTCSSRGSTDDVPALDCNGNAASSTSISISNNLSDGCCDDGFGQRPGSNTSDTQSSDAPASTACCSRSSLDACVTPTHSIDISDSSITAAVVSSSMQLRFDDDLQLTAALDAPDNKAPATSRFASPERAANSAPRDTDGASEPCIAASPSGGVQDAAAFLTSSQCSSTDFDQILTYEATTSSGSSPLSIAAFDLLCTDRNSNSGARLPRLTSSFPTSDEWEQQVAGMHCQPPAALDCSTLANLELSAVAHSTLDPATGCGSSCSSAPMQATSTAAAMADIHLTYSDDDDCDMAAAIFNSNQDSNQDSNQNSNQNSSYCYSGSSSSKPGRSISMLLADLDLSAASTPATSRCATPVAASPLLSHTSVAELLLATSASTDVQRQRAASTTSDFDHLTRSDRSSISYSCRFDRTLTTSGDGMGLSKQSYPTEWGQEQLSPKGSTFSSIGAESASGAHSPPDHIGNMTSGDSITTSSTGAPHKPAMAEPHAGWALQRRAAEGPSHFRGTLAPGININTKDAKDRIGATVKPIATKAEVCWLGCSLWCLMFSYAG